MHHGRSSVVMLCKLIKRNISVRKGTEEAWQVGFLVGISWPIASLVLFCISIGRNPQLVVDVWFFNLYMAQFALQVVWMFLSAILVTGRSAAMRLSIIERICTKEVTFEEEQLQVEGYMHYLNTCYHGFRVLGIPITKELGAKAIQIFFFSVIPLLFRVASALWTDADSNAVRGLAGQGKTEL